MTDFHFAISDGLLSLYSPSKATCGADRHAILDKHARVLANLNPVCRLTAWRYERRLLKPHCDHREVFATTQL